MSNQQPLLYVMDEDTKNRISDICARLHNGGDYSRDLGHKLWLALQQVEIMSPEDVKTLLTAR